MKNIQVVSDVTLRPADLRQQLKECEAKAKLIREALQIAERAARLTRLLADKAPTAAPPKNGKHEKVVPMRAVVARPLRDEIRALKPNLTRFTGEQVLERLSNFAFGSDPKKAVADALYQLRKQGEVKIVTHGKGGKANTFEWQQQPVKPREAASS